MSKKKQRKKQNEMMAMPVKKHEAIKTIFDLPEKREEVVQLAPKQSKFLLLRMGLLLLLPLLGILLVFSFDKPAPVSSLPENQLLQLQQYQQNLGILFTISVTADNGMGNSIHLSKANIGQTLTVPINTTILIDCDVAKHISFLPQTKVLSQIIQTPKDGICTYLKTIGAGTAILKKE